METTTMRQLGFGKHLYLFGDSISMGVIYDHEKSKYVKIKRPFAWYIKNSWKGVFQNYSKFGDTLSRGLNRIKSILEQDKGAIAMLEFGGNDSDYCWDHIAQHPNEKHYSRTPINLFIELLSGCIMKIISLDIQPILIIPPPIMARRYLNWICKNNHQRMRNIMLWLGNTAKLNKLHNKYCEAVDNIANQFGTIRIDLRKAFQNSLQYQDCFCIDGIHPNIKGHQIMGQYILKHLLVMCKS